MSSIGSISNRFSTLLVSNGIRSAIANGQQEMANLQLAIATGKLVNRPSDAPSRISAILALNGALATRQQHDRNLQFASGLLDSTDAAMADVTDILLEAQSIASSQIGIGSNSDTRANQATVIDQQINALIDIVNRRFQDVPMFAGSQFAPGRAVFEEFLGGIRYTGGSVNLEGEVGLDRPIGINTNGADVFNGLSSRVKSAIDLDPQATAATNLNDLIGAQGEGIRRGSIVVTVDAVDVTVDLATADTIGDVVTRVNDAINTLDPTAGALSVSATPGAGFELTANAGHTIDIADLQTSQTAGDLGIRITATAATTTGSDVHRKLTELTELSALGVPVDLLSGLKITHGEQTKVADFSAATTVQDLINAVDQLNLGLRLGVNDSGTGLNLISSVSGIELSVGENGGGTTATDLGLRTLGLDTMLSEFGFGIGVSSVVGEDDFEVRLHDGASNFRVNIDGVTTVSELITAISAAATGAGLTVGSPGSGGTDFNVGLAPDGNGIVLEDNTVGPDDFKVMNLGTSLAATDLGILKDAGAGGVINGDDNAQARAEGLFTHLINLRDALVNDDDRGITLAAEAIEKDVASIARVRADVGVRAQRVQQQLNRSQDLGILEQGLLSDLQDADMTEVITRFTQLQQQMEASLAVGGQRLQLSLLDFLR